MRFISFASNIDPAAAEPAGPAPAPVSVWQQSEHAQAYKRFATSKLKNKKIKKQARTYDERPVHVTHCTANILTDAIIS